MYLGYLNKYVYLRLGPRKKIIGPELKCKETKLSEYLLESTSPSYPHSAICLILIALEVLFAWGQTFPKSVDGGLGSLHQLTAPND